MTEQEFQQYLRTQYGQLKPWDKGELPLEVQGSGEAASYSGGYTPNFSAPLEGKNVGFGGGDGGPGLALWNPHYESDRPDNPAYVGRLTPAGDLPVGDGSSYGYYEGIYGTDGKLLDTRFRPLERSGGWLEENFEWAAPAAFALLTAGASSGLFGQSVSSAAAGGAGSAGAFGGLSEAALGELGINTALPAGAAGAPYGASPWLAGEAVGSEALLGGISGEAGADLLAGEVLKDTAGLDKLIWQSAAKDAAVQAGLSAELATMAGEVAGGLAGSGLTLDAAIASGLEAATAGAATGAVGGAGTVIGGGGALTAGLPGMVTGTSGAGLLSTLGSTAKDVWNTGKTAYTAAKPVIDAGKKLLGGGTSSSSGGLLGGLGGIGGILGLALLMAQLKKDKNAAPANQQAPIPRLRSRVEQKPFTLDAQGNRQAPLAYFGQPTYYAAGGGIGGLAAGGQASRAIRGPGDGVSDSIPAHINGEEPAALADGEFVIDARTVAELGNGSTEAGTRKLEAMVNRVHHARAKARRGEDSGADRHMPA